MNQPKVTEEIISGSTKTTDGAGQVVEIIHADVKSSNLNALRVRGGNRLKGEIKISGAKNAALKHMCAALLTDQPIQFTNMPISLGDVRTLSELLDYLGMTVALRSDGVAMLRTQKIKTTIAPYDLVRKMRASVLVLGPLLAREGQADISMPGGCAIGARPVERGRTAGGLGRKVEFAEGAGRCQLGCQIGSRRLRQPDRRRNRIVPPELLALVGVVRHRCGESFNVGSLLCQSVG